MKKIITKKQRAKKTQKNQAIIGIVLIALMVFSSLGYALGSDKNSEDNKKINYNDIDFIRNENGYWYFDLDGNDFVTMYNPKEVESIDFKGYFTLSDYSDKPLYMVNEFDDVNFEIINNLNRFIQRSQKACISEKNCLGNFPIKNCSMDNIIIVEEAGLEESEEIYQIDNCVFIKSSLVNQTKYADAFLFKILEI